MIWARTAPERLAIPSFQRARDSASSESENVRTSCTCAGHMVVEKKSVSPENATTMLNDLEQATHIAQVLISTADQMEA